MSLNRSDLVKKMNEASSVVLREKGYIAFVDVLLQMGKLRKDHYEAWRFGKVCCLEEVLSVNLAKVNHMLRTLHKNCRNGNLRASKTACVSWGKGPKRPLKFSKSGDPNIEAAYSTHFLRPKRAHNGVTVISGPQTRGFSLYFRECQTSESRHSRGFAYLVVKKTNIYFRH